MTTMPVSNLSITGLPPLQHREMLSDDASRNELQNLFLSISSTDTHRNAGNYRDVNLTNFTSFSLVETEDGEPVALSGVQHFTKTEFETQWSIYRILTRTYYYPRYRNGPLWSFGRKHRASFAENVFVPYQTALCRAAGVDVMFFSIEYPARRRAIESLAGVLSEGGALWNVPEGMYLVCRTIKNGSVIDHSRSIKCWQNVAINIINPASHFDLPMISIDEWHARFSQSLRFA